MTTNNKDILIKDYDINVSELPLKERISIVDCMYKFAHDNGNLRADMVTKATAIMQAAESGDEQELNSAKDDMRIFLVNEADLDEKMANILIDTVATRQTERVKYLLGDISYNTTW